MPAKVPGLLHLSCGMFSRQPGLPDLAMNNPETFKSLVDLVK